MGDLNEYLKEIMRKGCRLLGFSMACSLFSEYCANYFPGRALAMNTPSITFILATTSEGIL